MKRSILAGAMLVLFAGLSQAQDLDAIKNLMLLRQYKNVKPQIDKALTNEKTAKKAEAWALKTAIYTGVASDATTPKDQVDAILTEAIAAFAKYKELDPKYALMKDNAYISGPIDLYSSFFKKGVQGFNNKEWVEAYKNFSSAVDMSDFLVETKITAIKMDTTAILYAGASAQNNKDDANAAKYFKRLADDKVAGADNEFLYQFLANYYMETKDEANMSKYLNLGKTLYPNSKYFTSLEQDYANSKDPFFINMRDGEEAFAKLYPKDEAAAPQGEEAAKLEATMVTAFNKAAEAKADKAGLAYTNIANHYINKGVFVNKRISAVNDEIRNVNKNAKPDKNGKFPPVPKDLLSKRDGLYKEYDMVADTAIMYFEKAFEAFSKKGTLDNIEKHSLKNGVSYLIDLNAEKKNNTLKTKPAESAKFAAQEKKWTAEYSKIH